MSGDLRLIRPTMSKEENLFISSQSKRANSYAECRERGGGGGADFHGVKTSCVWVISEQSAGSFRIFELNWNNLMKCLKCSKRNVIIFDLRVLKTRSFWNSTHSSVRIPTHGPKKLFTLGQYNSRSSCFQPDVLRQLKLSALNMQMKFRLFEHNTP